MRDVGNHPGRARRAVLLIAATALVAARAAAQDATAPPQPRPAFARTEQRSRCDHYDPLRRPFFGDLHVHTAFSLDASTQGTRNRPRDAYRFARGEEVGLQPHDASGKPLRTLRLARPLDFAAVTDHAEFFGELSICETPGLPGYDGPTCMIYRRWPRLAYFLINGRASGTGSNVERFRFCGEQAADCLAAARTPWREIQEAAEGAYDRTSACRFATFVGYEWTAAPDSNNLHRNVIFRNAAVPKLPISYLDEPTVTGLWRRLDAECRRGVEGCESVVIPHNSNLSGGLMFQTTQEDGSPIDAGYAEARALAEPLAEIMQHKGDSECAVAGAARDELCGFEKLPYDNFGGKYSRWLRRAPEPSSYLRHALGQGLLLEEKLGRNPFKLGFVASTDTHLGTPGAVDERDHPGHGGAGAPATDSVPLGLSDDVEFNPGGLAVLWAEENSRDALFAAMRRREAYGTSGPRMTVRFFGGFGLPERLCAEHDFVARGYADGVPMGGDLAQPPAAGGAPRFAVRALRDPGTPGRPGTALQRIQIVKGWVEGDVVREKIYDVAGGPNDADVDLATCTPRGHGADELCAVWTDPEFDPAVRAFWYARVLENPTCRWSTRACNAARVRCGGDASVAPGFEGCCDERYPRAVQERAWTSPVWYAPAPRATPSGS
ncbi:MAG: DUF3604 domain-containing protein [Thermodesulfobacteriota bacterium]